MASSHESKKGRSTSAADSPPADTKPVRSASTIGGVVPIETMTASKSWEQDADDGLAAGIRVFFLSHTLDPLTGEVHTLH